jgi:Arc/MetJ family transcription regulator
MIYNELRRNPPVSHLTRLHEGSIIMHMRTTLNIDDELLKRAARLTGVSEKTALVRMGLQALIEREAALRLAELGGTDPEAEAGRRRRPDDDQ